MGERNAIVPDTSIIIEGKLSRLLKAGKLKDADIFISQIVIDELEAQANRGLEIGFDGLREIAKLRGLVGGSRAMVEGVRPSPDEIRLAKKGRLDAMIRDLAKQKNAILYTQDLVQAEAARAEGLAVEYTKPRGSKGMPLEGFFSDDTMSVHLKEGALPMAKRGTPRDVKLVTIGSKPLEKKELEKLSEEIIGLTRHREDANVEISRRGGDIVQIGRYRIAIARPPFSSGMEITAVRPTVKLVLDDYKPGEKLTERLRTKAEGLLITGPPGSGKTTFAQSLAEFYWKQGKIVKTMESPRDLVVPPEITQYGPLEGSMANTADILLLVRPDYTIYDELRTTNDFRIFADMRLAGVGMVGVVHSADPIDAVHRFMSRTELGMVPHIIDTIIYISGGRIEKIYSLSLCVRVPTGMTDSDLARPVVEIRDFGSGRLEYEIYTYGEENVAIPVEKEQPLGMEKLAKERLYEEFCRYDRECEIEIAGRDRAIVRVRNEAIGKIIGRGGERIDEIEKRLGIHIEVQPKVQTLGREIEFKTGESGAYISLFYGKELRGKTADVYVDGDYLFSATIGKEGQIKVAKGSEAGKGLVNAMASKKEIKTFITG